MLKWHASPGAFVDRAWRLDLNELKRIDKTKDLDALDRVAVDATDGSELPKSNW
jgi:hypothetical protein